MAAPECEDSIVSARQEEPTTPRPPSLFPLVPAALLAILFWRQEAIDPLTASSLTVDRCLQVASLLALPGVGVAVFGGVVWARRAVAFVSVTGASLALTVLLAGLIRPPADWAVLGLAALALGGSGLVAVRTVVQLEGWSDVRTKLVAAVLASVLPLLQLLNGVSFLPARTEASIVQEVDVEVVGVAGDDLRTQVTYTATNNTDVRVLVIISRLNLCWWDDAVPESDQDVDARTVPDDRGECRSESPIAAGAWLSPESSLTFSQALLVPGDRRRLTASARVAFARGDRLRLVGNPEAADDLGDCSQVRTVRIAEESRFKGLAQVDKFLVYGDSDGDGGINYYFVAGPESELACDRSQSSGLAEYFGTTESRQVTEVWLVEPEDSSGGAVSVESPVEGSGS